MSSAKKIVFFGFISHFGGAQQSSVLLCKYLKRFYDVRVIDAYGSCDKYMNALAERNITTYVLSAEAKDVVIGYASNLLKRMLSLIKQLPTLFRLRRRLIKQIVKIDPDVIWTSGFKSFFFLAANLRLRKYSIAFYARGWYKQEQVPWYARWLIRHRVQAVLAVSNSTSENLQSWGVEKGKIHVVFNTLDFEHIINDGNKEPSDLPPGMSRKFKILVPAVLLRTKGQHTAIKAATLLRKRELDFVMWLAGDVSVGDRSGYCDYLHELIRINGLEENVYLLGWRSDVRALMRLADAVVLPTHTEGLPRAVQEVMILERPVISTPVGGILDLIIDGQTGLLFPVDDENALAMSIEKIMKDKNLADNIAKNGHNRMHNEFSTEKHIAAVRQALQTIIEN